MGAITVSKALRRFRVLDLSRVRSGPTCARMLADFGADVIRIEPPEGVDPNDGMVGSARAGGDFQNLNRNKRSLTLNLKKPEGMEIFRRLVGTADVVLENWRPDVKQRLGIDYDSLKALNPRIILASISGFGQEGPYAMRPGFDQIAQGMGGLMSITGYPEQGPQRAGIAVSDSSAGLYAACGVLTALLEREVSGEGQWVHTSLLHAMIAMLDFQAARYLVEGEVPTQVGNDHPTTTPMGLFKTSDGYLNLGISGEGQWKVFCQLAERPDWLTRPEFATNGDRLKNRAMVNDAVQKVFLAGTTSFWVETLNAAGVPAGPVLSVPEMFEDPQVRSQNVQKAATNEEGKPVNMITQPVVLSRTPADVIDAAPQRGAHTDDILAELGMSDRDIERVRDAGAV